MLAPGSRIRAHSETNRALSAMHSSKLTEYRALTDASLKGNRREILSLKNNVGHGVGRSRSLNLFLGAV